MPTRCVLRARGHRPRRRGRVVFPNLSVAACTVAGSVILPRAMLHRTRRRWVSVCELWLRTISTLSPRASARRGCSIVGRARTVILTSRMCNSLSGRDSRWMVRSARCPSRHSTATKFRRSCGCRDCGATVIHRSEQLTVGPRCLLVLNLRAER